MQVRGVELGNLAGARPLVQAAQSGFVPDGRGLALDLGEDAARSAIGGKRRIALECGRVRPERVVLTSIFSAQELMATKQCLCQSVFRQR